MFAAVLRPSSASAQRFACLLRLWARIVAFGMRIAGRFVRQLSKTSLTGAVQGANGVDWGARIANCSTPDRHGRSGSEFVTRQPQSDLTISLPQSDLTISLSQSDLTQISLRHRTGAPSEWIGERVSPITRLQTVTHARGQNS